MYYCIKMIFSLPSSVCAIQCHVAMATVGPSKLLHRRPPAETVQNVRMWVKFTFELFYFFPAALGGSTNL